MLRFFLYSCAALVAAALAQLCIATKGLAEEADVPSVTYNPILVPMWCRFTGTGQRATSRAFPGKRLCIVFVAIDVRAGVVERVKSEGAVHSGGTERLGPAGSASEMRSLGNARAWSRWQKGAKNTLKECCAVGRDDIGSNIFK